MATRSVATGRTVATARTLASGSSATQSGIPLGILLSVTQDQTVSSGSRGSASSRTSI